MVFAIALALLASHPEIVLAAVAYLYLLSAFVGLALHRFQKRGHEPAVATAPEPEPEPEPEQEAQEEESERKDQRPEMPQLPDLPG
jgi:hypothetical protein